MSDEIKFHSDLDIVCPCGRKVSVDRRNYAVIHELPMCEKFRDLGVVEYLRYVRIATTVITDN